jgi:hypothetical protein
MLLSIVVGLRNIRSRATRHEIMKASCANCQRGFRARLDMQKQQSWFLTEPLTAAFVFAKLPRFRGPRQIRRFVGVNHKDPDTRYASITQKSATYPKRANDAL